MTITTDTGVRRRTLGAQGLTVSSIGLGCMGLTEFYGADTSAADPARVIHRALDLGVDFLDTSDAYGPHTNEEVLGRALVGHRDRVVLSTKFGLERRTDQADGVTPHPVNGRPEYVRAALEGSLRRLRTDHVDLYIQHRLDPDTPVEETVGAMGELVAEGKVRFLALCEVGPDTIRRAHATAPLSAVHAEYSLWSRDPEDLVLPVLDELGLGFLPYSPLGRGFLTGRIRSLDAMAPDDWRRHSPRFQGANFARNLELVDRIRALAAAKGITPAQLALAWILHRGDNVVPFQGATRVAELEENLGALDVELTAADMSAIDAVAPVGAAAGAAWPEGSPGAPRDER
jgi:aryl-alcohol dehydrogenase-like predicted oxidoreductase